MAYELHITRAEMFMFNDGAHITPEEWMAIVNQDPELVQNISGGQYFANWQSEYAPPDAWFDWYEGNVFTKNPDRMVLGKSLDIAYWLGAQVQGDNGETYTSVEEWPE
jgi:hypothetical protein